MPKSSDQNFKVFHDEVTTQDSMQADRNWRKQHRTLRENKYTRVLLLSVLVMALILGLLLSMLEKHQPEHTKTEYSDSVWQVQSLMPHLVFLVEKGTEGREARDIVSLGMAHGGLVAWLEGNLRTDWQVLLVPNQQAGVNVLGVTAAYYLRTGSLTILADDSQYITLTQQNIDLMKELHPDRPFKVQISSSYSSDTRYDLVIIERNTFHQHINTTSTDRIVIVRKENSQNSIMRQSFGQYGAYQIVKGSISQQIRDKGRRVGYAVVPYVPSSETVDRTVFLQKYKDRFPPSLCPEESEEQDSLSVIQFLRNHTLEHSSLRVFFAAKSIVLLRRLGQDLKSSEELIVPLDAEASLHNGTAVESIDEAILEEQKKAGRLSQIVVIIEADHSLPARSPSTTILIHITSDEQLQPFLPLDPTFISPNNNHGCFYPPSLLPTQPPTPFYLALSPSH